LELKRLRDELSSEAFKNLYRELQEKHGMLSPFPTVFDLIEFFHGDSGDYAVKDSILGFLVTEYQKGGRCHRLGAFFLVLFTPGIVRVYSMARKRALVLDPAEVLNQACLYLLETINGIPFEQNQSKVASHVLGRVKNLMRGWVNQRLKEEAAREDLLEEERHEPLPILEDGKDPVDIEDAARFLEIFLKAGVITETDKLIILGASLKRGSLREISGDSRAYQKMKKRRQRAISAMKLYLQKSRRLRALEEGLCEEEISLAEIVRDLLE